MQARAALRPSGRRGERRFGFSHKTDFALTIS